MTFAAYDEDGVHDGTTVTLSGSSGKVLLLQGVDHNDLAGFAGDNIFTI